MTPPEDGVSNIHIKAKIIRQHICWQCGKFFAAEDMETIDGHAYCTKDAARKHARDGRQRAMSR